MQGHHRSRCCLRPCPWQADADSNGRAEHHWPQGRLFLCAEPACRVQVVICSDCDRGHIYCADCAQHARRRSQHEAGRRYQASSRGRIKHAERSRRWRERQNGARENKVTHHGSPPDRSAALLSVDPVVVEQRLFLDNQRSAHEWRWYCMRCGRRCSAHVRQDFLRRRVRRHRRKGPESDDPS
jgi:hypothetical protein